MDPTTLARWQFATTTVYHFLIVPLSIGLTLLVATMQTLAYRRRGTEAGATWDRAARFWGRIMLVLFALGVVTGIVQEFQFGMNWSRLLALRGRHLRRAAGDGGPDRVLPGVDVPRAVDLRPRPARPEAAPGDDLAGRRRNRRSAPTSSSPRTASCSTRSGCVYDPAKNRVELTSIWKVLTNSTQLVTFPHTILAAFMTAARDARLGERVAPAPRPARPPTRCTAGSPRSGWVSLLVSAVGVTLVGHVQGQIMTEQQPMKMAAAEAQWDTRDHAPFSLFAYANVEEGHNKIDIAIPNGLSILATNHPGGTVEGINDVQAEEQAKYGPGSYIPVVWMAYWSFRLMIGFGVLAALIALAMIVQWRRGRMQHSDKLLRMATWTVVLPLLANTSGWLFTETARQPWLVYGLLRTSDGVSPNVCAGFVLTTLIGFTALYGVLGIICFRLAKRIAKAGPDPDIPTLEAPTDDSLSLV